MNGFFKFRCTRGNLIRLAAVAAGSFLIFGFVLLPCVVNGPSMLPTYAARGFNFCNTLPMRFRAPRRGEVVIVRLHAGKLLLKRVVAFAGETVEFRDGVLFVNGEKQYEPYVKTASDWKLPPRKVEEDCVYVVGDNRGMEMSYHVFGQVRTRDVIGVPLW